MRTAHELFRRTLEVAAFALVLCLVMLQLGGRPLHAGTSLQPARPAATPTPQVQRQYVDEKLEGSYLALRVKPANFVYWTTVEWQDGSGMWHLVDGWTGYTRDGGLRWYADKDLLGKGPFRWNVFTQDRCRLLVPGVPFLLPKQRGGTVVTSVTIDPYCNWSVTTNYVP